MVEGWLWFSRILAIRLDEFDCVPLLEVVLGFTG